MKKYGLFAFLLCLALALTACSRGETAPPETEPSPAAAEPSPIEVEPSAADTGEDYAPELRFSAADVLSGEIIDETVFREHSVTMVNMWEPWCGPCVAEMPELERLYEDRKAEGFLILGVYATEDGMQQVLEDCGTAYPVIPFQPGFLPYDSGYVPTSFFVDASGHVLTSPLADQHGTLFVGGNSYEGWVKVLESLEYDAES